MFIAAGAVGFLYFARPVVLPIVMAGVAGMTLKPLVRWLSYCHIPPVIGAAIVLGLLVIAIGIGFVQLGRPAVAWVNEAPEQMDKQSYLRPCSRAVLRQRTPHELNWPRFCLCLGVSLPPCLSAMPTPQVLSAPMSGRPGFGFFPRTKLSQNHADIYGVNTP